MSKGKESHQRPHQLATYQRLIRYARPYLSRLIVGTLFGIVFAGSTIGILGASKSALKDVFQHAEFKKVLFIAVLLPLLALGRGLGQFLSGYFIQWVGNRVVMDLRTETFAKLQNLSISFFTKSKTGELISRTINDSMMVERAVSAVLGDLVKQPFVLIGAVCFVLWLDAKLALATFVLFPLCLIPILLFGRRVRRYARHGQERLAELVSLMHEGLMGIRIVQAFGMQGYEVARFTLECKRFFNRIMRVVRAKTSIEPIIVFISTIGLALILIYARIAHMPVEDFITFALAMMFMYEPAKKLSRVHLHIQQTSAAADRIFEILDTPVTIRDYPAAITLHEPIKSLQFDHVSFAYDRKIVLDDINFTVGVGERFAIVGGSGAGKTTLVNLLPRFYDVSSGKILINNEDIKHITLKSLRSKIGFVTQDIVLFNDTVANNIAYGDSDKFHEKIEGAAVLANAHDFIMQLPEGYDTIIGEHGVRLSIGQCQRLAIARAVLRNPPILILDEATSALDSESERLVQAAINRLMERRTVLAIAHRLSTIIHCDNIIVLENNKIVESGTHQQLLKLNGVYRKLYNMQFSDMDNNQ